LCQQSPFYGQLLGAQQKEHCLSEVSDLLECIEVDEKFFKNIVRCDETWVCGYDPENKLHLFQQPKNAH
jgi:hypothetical protein